MELDAEDVDFASVRASAQSPPALPAPSSRPCSPVALFMSDQETEETEGPVMSAIYALEEELVAVREELAGMRERHGRMLALIISLLRKQQ